ADKQRVAAGNDDNFYSKRDLQRDLKNLADIPGIPRMAYLIHFDPKSNTEIDQYRLFLEKHLNGPASFRDFDVIDPILALPKIQPFLDQLNAETTGK
ncbi:MAG: hypothetical protein AAGE65_12525, partial [Planctomycetota bacterium]